MPQRPTRVLLLGDELHASLGAVRALRAAGHEPWFAAPLSGTYASRSRTIAGTVTVPDPDRRPEDYVDAVLAATVRCSIDVVLPGTESSLVRLAGRAADFPPSVAVGAPDAEVVERVLDKAEVLRLAHEVGLETPETLAAEPDALAAEANRLTYPAILKPLRSKLATDDRMLRYVKAIRVETPDQLRDVLSSLADETRVVQPYIDGELAAVGGVAWNGELICAVHQVARRIWPPHVGVSAYAATVPPDAEVERRLAALVRRIGWSGVFEVQFLRADGRRYLIDFNPRIYGSIALAVAAGQNLPAIWTELLLGRRPRSDSYRVGVRYRFEHNDVLALTRALVLGPRSEFIHGLVPRRRTVHAIFSLRDPGPLLTTLGKLKRRVGRAGVDRLLQKPATGREA